MSWRAWSWRASKPSRPQSLSDMEAVQAIMSAGPDGVPLAPYRRMLRAAYAYDEGVSLLAAGGSIRGLQHPLLFVLLNTDSPEVLIEKEARLGGFIHSRHRVDIESSGEHHLVLRHVSMVSAAPDPLENIAACGQHIALLEEIGCQQLKCRFADSDVWFYLDGVFGRPPTADQHRWHFEWNTFEPARRPMPGLDELLMRSVEDFELSELAPPVAEVVQVVRQDLGRTWKVADVATALNTSPRSLQRALAAVNERFSDLIDRVRNEEAARLLRHGSGLSVTEVGYVCGFADSAHFSRSFKKRYGAPPSVFRHQA